MSEKWLNDEDLEKILGKVEQSTDSDVTEAELPKHAVEVRTARFEELSDEEEGAGTDLNLLLDVPLEVRVLLGSVEKTIEEIIQMSEGSIIQLDQVAGEPVELLIGEHVIAKGETVIIDDKFGVLINEIVPPKERIRSVEGKLKKQTQ